MTDWNARFLDHAAHVAEWSKDRSTKVGAIVVGPDHEIRATGYNGFPRGVDDGVDARHERPAKYRWTEHAERNAIFNAARFGAPLMGCTIYVTHPPCTDCARAIIQAGIQRAVFRMPDSEMVGRWKEDFEIAHMMLWEARVSIEIEA